MVHGPEKVETLCESNLSSIYWSVQNQNSADTYIT